MFVRSVFSLLVILVLCAFAPIASARTPLLQEGKKTLFQRVVTHPGAMLTQGADPKGTQKEALKTFTMLYVYDKQGDQLEVGRGTNKADGWIQAPESTFWPQAITMVFTERMGRMPVLFFEEHQKLIDVCESESLGEDILALNKQIQAAATTALPESFPVLAAEPDDTKGAVSKDRFYLLPVLSVDDRFAGQTKLLEVASIDPGTDTLGSDEKKEQATTAEKPDDATLRTGIVFVIDTTISMRPYIEQTKALLRTIYDELEKSPDGDKVAFAIVAYRSDLESSPKLGYRTEVISDFKTVTDRKALEKTFDQLQEATASSHSFDEDAMAGIQTALEDLTWGPYGSRAMLLISDAGAISSADPTGATGLAPQEMLDVLQSHQIWPSAIHVKTPQGKKNHASAEQSYRTLTKLADNSASYIPIDATTAEKGAQAFDSVATALATGYREMVEATAKGQVLNKPEEAAPAIDPESRAKQIADLTGYAMQLEFLGKKKGNHAPSVVRAWIADADLERLANQQTGAPIIAVQPTVLLTKNQLSDLSQQLKIIIDNAERTKRTDAQDFFEGIISAAAQLTRDPNRFSHNPKQNLAETGVLAEFLDGLPYKSDILLMREEDWYNKSTGEQTAFINRLKSRLMRYEAYDKDRANWESFGATDAGDWVYRVPLSMLP